MALCDYDATTQRAGTPRRATARDTTRTMSEASFRSRASNLRSDSGGGAGATALAAVEPVDESESYGLREVDTRTRGERARDYAVRFVTDKVRNAPQAEDGGAVQGGAFTSVDAGGNVYADPEKMEAIGTEALETALAQIPEDDDDDDDASNPGAAFQKAFALRKMREDLFEQVKEACMEQASQEMRIARRRALVASHATQPKAPPQRQSGLVQPEFLSNSRKAMGEANSAKMSYYQAPDPYDESVFGVTNTSIYRVKNDARTTQRMLEFLLGYSSVVDPDDLEEIEAGAMGLTVSRGKSMRELALKYATHLDKTLPERHANVVKSLVKTAADDFIRQELLGFDAAQAYAQRERESASEVAATNKQAWITSMFPDALWPNKAKVGGADKAALPSVGTLGAIGGGGGGGGNPGDGAVQVRMNPSGFNAGSTYSGS